MISVFFLAGNVTGNKVLPPLSSINKDSTIVDSLQYYLSKDSSVITKYFALINELKSKEVELIKLQNNLKNIENEIIAINNQTVFVMQKYKIDTSANSESKYINKLKDLFDKSIKAQSEKNNTQDLIKQANKNKEKLKQNLSDTEKKYNNSIKLFKHFASGITGSKSLVFLGIRYNVFVADLDKNIIQLHYKRPNGAPFNSIGEVHKYLLQSKQQALMITNAGMFTPSSEPAGLYIESTGKILYPLDTGKSTKPNPDNFYLLPNGVFYIDSDNKAHIDTTEFISKLLKSGQVNNMKIATQSGPMLVINNRIHNSFSWSSNNRKIRSGVGIINDKRVVFIISKEETVFYEVSVLFRDIFNCSNALFLDGAISKMYLSDIDSTTMEGFFGPMLSVTKK
jgi:uncharacterized protein YigE (DUF2233 family)